jgi:polysaccharide export outer membrane protein
LKRLALIALLCTTACHNAPYVWVNQRMPEPKSLNNLTVIGVGDLVMVDVMGDEKMSGQWRVLPDGTLTLPVLGPVQVAGKNSEELARELETQLTKLIQLPKVTVFIQESQISVSVIGEVKQAGALSLSTPANVLQALAKAGGLTDYADSSGIYVLRTDHGKTQRIRFKYRALVDAEPAATGFMLKTGDMLVVE